MRTFSFEIAPDTENLSRPTGMATTRPIYLVGGSRADVDKILVLLALADYLQHRDFPVVLVETDTSNPDVRKAMQDEEPG